MLKAEIICVGTELLMGQVLNTNEQYIASHLTDAGIGLNHSSVVGDNPGRLRDAVSLAKSRSDVIILTGGLGPTDDDLTKETVSAAFGKNLVFHPECMEKMISYLKEAGRNITKNNEKQAYLPDGCRVIENNNGTAPGCIIEEGDKCAVMLPGPPREMVPMFEETVMPYLKSKSPVILSSRVLRLFGIGESRAAAMCEDLIKNQTNPTIAPYAKEGEVTFRITASSYSETTAEKMVDETCKKMYERLGDYIYGEGDDNSMAAVVVKKLKEKGKSLSTCESCTGGLIGKMITDIPGSSSVYGFGFITYANEAKMGLVGVKKETIDAYSAVSEEAAEEMAVGARRASGSDIAVSVTGYAGPGGDNVGLVYIGIADENGCEVQRFVQHGDRERVRNKSALCALNMIRERLEEEE